MATSSILGLMALSALPAAHGRVWSGTLINSPFSGELGRFAYGPGGGTAAVTVPANPLATPAVAQLSSYTEATWKAASPPSCTSATDGALTFTTSSTAPVTATASFAGGDKTRWVFALSGQPFSPAQNPPCPSLSADYTLTALQASGSQLSYEEQGLPAIYACFWVFMVLALGAHAYGHIVAPLPQGYPKGARPPLVVALLVALTLHATSDTFHLIEWAYVDITGKESGYFLAVMGGLLRLGALACIWVMAAFLATGYGVTTRRVALMENNNWRGALLLGVLVILGLTATFLYASATRGTPNPSAAGVGITLVFFTLGYLAWFVRQTMNIIAAEVSVPRKTLLSNLLWTTVGTFLILPFAEILSYAVPSYEALRITVGLDMFLTQASAMLYVFFLWPSRSAEAFHSVDTLLGGSDSGMEEAYAYVPMAKDETTASGVV